MQHWKCRWREGIEEQPGLQNLKVTAKDTAWRMLAEADWHHPQQETAHHSHGEIWKRRSKFNQWNSRINYQQTCHTLPSLRCHSDFLTAQVGRYTASRPTPNSSTGGHVWFCPRYTAATPLPKPEPAATLLMMPRLGTQCHNYRENMVYDFNMIRMTAWSGGQDRIPSSATYSLCIFSIST